MGKALDWILGSFWRLLLALAITGCAGTAAVQLTYGFQSPWWRAGWVPMLILGAVLYRHQRSSREQPSAIIPYSGPPLTEQQAAEFRERLDAALADPGYARRRRHAPEADAASALCWAWWRTGVDEGHHRCMLPGDHPGLCECCCGAKRS